MNTTKPDFLYLEEPLTNPGYVEVWTIEQNFSLNAWRKWFGTNWIWSLYLSIAYFVGIHLSQIAMKKRSALELRKALTFWNIGLAAFSFFGTLRTGAELVYILQKPDGFYASICSRDDHNIAAACWGCLFVLSKAVELGDTVFIVLRKQNLLFLHWYHHITVLCYTWFTFESNPVTSRWFGVMNYAIHTIMYSYYALRALRVRVPRCVSMVITTLQILQMVFGIHINVYAAYVKYAGLECFVEMKHITAALLMYASYFLLFAKFFCDAYLKSSSFKKSKNAIPIPTDVSKSNITTIPNMDEISKAAAPKKFLYFSSMIPKFESRKEKLE